MKRRLSNQDIADLALRRAFPLCDEGADKFACLLERFAALDASRSKNSDTDERPRDGNGRSTA